MVHAGNLSLVSIDGKLTVVNIRSLVFATDKVDVSGSAVSITNFPASFAVTQGTSPWLISGSVSVSNFPAVQAVSQSGTWTTGRTWSLTSGTDSVASVQSGAWSVGRTWVLASGTDSVSVVQSTSPWVISGTVTANLGTIAGAATAANQTTQITSLQILDDVPTAQNGAFVKGNPIMGQLDDTSTVVATEDNVAAVRITPQRAVHVNIRNQAGTEIGTTTNPIIAGSISGLNDIANLTFTGKMYAIAIDINAATAGADNRLVLFRNPAGSGKTIYIRRIDFGNDIANVSLNGKVFSDPTVTVNGLAITVGNRYVGGGAAGVALLTSLPTIAVLGTQIDTGVSGANSNTFVMDMDFSLAIAPGHSILFTADPSSNNRNVALTMIWAEI